jgi:hypothetical protein
VSVAVLKLTPSAASANRQRAYVHNNRNNPIKKKTTDSGSLFFFLKNWASVLLFSPPCSRESADNAVGVSAPVVCQWSCDYNLATCTTANYELWVSILPHLTRLLNCGKATDLLLLALPVTVDVAQPPLPGLLPPPHAVAGDATAWASARFS